MSAAPSAVRGVSRSALATCVAYALLAGVVCGLVAGTLSGWVTLETVRVINAGATQRASAAWQQRLDLERETAAGLASVQTAIRAAPLCRTR